MFITFTLQSPKHRVSQRTYDTRVGGVIESVMPETTSLFLQLSMCLSFTNPVLVQLHLLRYWNETKAYKNAVYLLAKQLVEQLATLHLPALGAVLNVFAQEHADGCHHSPLDVDPGSGEFIVPDFSGTKNPS